MQIVICWMSPSVQNFGLRGFFNLLSLFGLRRNHIAFTYVTGRMTMRSLDGISAAGPARSGNINKTVAQKNSQADDNLQHRGLASAVVRALSVQAAFRAQGAKQTSASLERCANLAGASHLWVRSTPGALAICTQEVLR